jgi:Prp8 binding protein
MNISRAYRKHHLTTSKTSFPVTVIAISEAGDEIYTGDFNDNIHVYGARKLEDTITSLEVSPDSRFLLSNLHDWMART